MSKVICLLGAVGYSGFLHWELWKMQNTNIVTVTTTPKPTTAANDSTQNPFHQILPSLTCRDC